MTISKKGQKKNTVKKTDEIKAESHRRDIYHGNLLYWYVLGRVISGIDALPENLRNKISPLEERCFVSFGRAFLSYIMFGGTHEELVCGVSPTLSYGNAEALILDASKVLSKSELLLLKNEIAHVHENAEYPEGISKKEVDAFVQKEVDYFMRANTFS